MRAEIRLMGLVGIRSDNGVVRALEADQLKVAFARLVLERERGTTRDELANAIWPGCLPSTWGSALRSLVSRLRGFVQESIPAAHEPLVSQAGRYLLKLPPDVVVDAEVAEGAVVAAQEAFLAGDLETARRLGCDGAERLRAPFLPSHEGPWSTSWRDHLAELFVSGLETASRAASALGDTTRALVLAEEATAFAPLRESAHRCRMAAHAAAGNRAEALRAYQRLRRLLADELGVDPAPDTEAAYLELLGAAPSPLAVTNPNTRHDNAPFVGRDSEIGLIAHAWANALDRQRRLLLVSGEAGAGKTRLVKEAGRRIAGDGGLVLFGRNDRESIVPYQPFAEALGSYISASPEDELAQLSPGSRRELAAVFPTAEGDHPMGRPGAGASAAGVSGSASAEPARLYGAVTELVTNAARKRPVLLLLDDLHWAAHDTLWLLRHLLRYTDDARLLVIATVRDDMSHTSSLLEVIRGLDRDGLTSRLSLEGLSTAAIRKLAEQMLPGSQPDVAELAGRLHADTTGNAFMAVELLRQFDAAGAADPLDYVPRGIHDLVSAKLLTAESPDVERLLHAAAVTGVTFELEVAARAAGLDFAAALDALDAALLAGFVVDAEAGVEAADVAHYRFRHEVSKRALSGRLSEARRHHLRSRVAAASSSPGTPARQYDLVH